MKACVVPSLVAVLALAGCSSVGVSDLQKSGKRVTVAPTRILIEPFAIRPGALNLGERSQAEKQELGREIVRSLAERTAGEVQRYAARSSVLAAGQQPAPGTWVVRGEILKVDQGSRALRAGVGLGMGRTHFHTRVQVLAVQPGGATRLLTFRTTGSSGLEPGAALGVATGGATLVGTGASLAMGSLAGVSSDIDRTAFETAAVLSSYLARNGLLDPSRRAQNPNMAGQLPSGINTRRILPAPVRDHVAP